MQGYWLLAIGILMFYKGNALYMITEIEQNMEEKTEDSMSWIGTMIAILIVVLVLSFFFGVQYLICAAIWSYAEVNGFIARNWFWLIPVDIVATFLKLFISEILS